MAPARQDASRGDLRLITVELTGPGADCAWCHQPIPERSPSGRRTRADAEVCGVVCRKRRNRFLRAVLPDVEGDASPGPSTASSPGRIRVAYADPPYPGKAGYYAEHPDGGRGEVDHVELIGRLERDYPDGWALSTSSSALRAILPMCPASTRVCVWRRRVRYSRSTRALSAWEPLLVVGGRPLSTDGPQELLDDLETPDVWLDERDPVLDEVLDYRGRYAAFPGALVGMKPPEFATWLFRQLGARAGDELDDLYPGSGAIGRAWAAYTSHLQADGVGGCVPAIPGTHPAAIAP